MNPAINVEKKVKEIHGYKHNELPDFIFEANEPLILKNLVSDWPLVKLGLHSPDAVAPYLMQYYSGQSVSAFLGKPENQGRVFYNDTMTGFNYDVVSTKLDFALEQLQLHSQNSAPPTIYLGSTSIDNYLPGFRAENDLQLPDPDALASIWISNKSRIAAHWDSPRNIACCAVGRRRFTVFPFDQIDNLYPGPLERTPAGQEISMVDFYNPDFEQFPKFREALKVAQVADLSPGDALFLPRMWWHHVESLEPLNILVNYWFIDNKENRGRAVSALLHSILAIRDLSDEQKHAWKLMFDKYVFNYHKDDFNYLPENARGVVGELDDNTMRRIRALLLSQLNK